MRAETGFTTLALLLTALTVCGGCRMSYQWRSSQRQRISPIQAFSSAPDSPDLSSAPVAASVQGRELSCTVYGSGRETVLVLGGIHGSEPASTALCEQLEARLAGNVALCGKRRVVVLAAANPDGLARGKRTNARGVDLNRNFQTRNRINSKRFGLKAMSEPESRYITEIIRLYRPVRILTLHQPLACVDWDGPARDLAEVIAQASSLPVRKLGAQPGSLGTYAGIEKRIPIVTLELPAGATAMKPDVLWHTYGPGLLAGVTFDHAQSDAK